MGIRALIDTNILLDYMIFREPYTQSAEIIVDACRKKVFEACIAAHSVSNIFYILRKEYSVEARKNVLKDICKIVDVIGIDKSKIETALEDEKFTDFEDCLQEQCAIAYGADYIVTRNPKDFKFSAVPCISPEDFCKLIAPKSQPL